MTRGILIYIDEDMQLHSTIEFNGNMFPNKIQGHGDKIIAYFALCEKWDTEEFYDFVEEFDENNFGYKSAYGSELILSYGLSELKYDIKNNWTDYLYIINGCNDDFIIIGENGETIIRPNSIAVCNFQKVIEIIPHMIVQRL